MCGMWCGCRISRACRLWPARSGLYVLRNQQTYTTYRPHLGSRPSIISSKTRWMSTSQSRQQVPSNLVHPPHCHTSSRLLGAQRPRAKGLEALAKTFPRQHPETIKTHSVLFIPFYLYRLQDTLKNTKHVIDESHSNLWVPLAGW